MEGYGVPLRISGNLLYNPLSGLVHRWKTAKDIGLLISRPLRVCRISRLPVHRKCVYQVT